jgi:hypothetical protein
VLLGCGKIRVGWNITKKEQMSLSTQRRSRAVRIWTAPTKEEQPYMYSGKSPGLTFEAFGESVVSWGRQKFGERFAKALWRDEMVVLEKVDLDDPESEFNFESYCNLVYEVIMIESPKYAESAKFKTVKFQVDTRRRLREQLFCYVEMICFGEARRLLKKAGVAGFNEIRRKFFVRFGAGQPEALTGREEKFMLGMPNDAGEAFSPLVNMEDKLDQLEAERE